MEENMKVVGRIREKNALEQCGFIRKYTNYTKPINSAYYQLIDLFSLFSLNFMNKSKTNSWLNYINSPSYNAWRGNAYSNIIQNKISGDDLF